MDPVDLSKIMDPVEFLLHRLSQEVHHPLENRFMFSISENIREAHLRLSGPILAHIIRSKPDDVISLFDTNTTSYSRWMNHVTTSDIVRAQNWKREMGLIKNQGHHNTCWAIVAAELISAIRFILGYDEVYTDYSAQFLVDYVNMELANKTYTDTRRHYCFEYKVAKALEFVKDAGIPLEKHWKYVGCRGTRGIPNYKPPPKKDPLVSIDSVVKISSIHEALPHVQFHPIGASLAIFVPDYYIVEKEVYRGPMYLESKFKCLHAVSIINITEEDGETIALVKSSHGEDAGYEGYFRVSCDVEMVEVPWEGQEANKNFKKPRRLLSRFCFPELLPR